MPDPADYAVNADDGEQDTTKGNRSSWGSDDPYDTKFGRTVGEGVGNLGNMGGGVSATIPTLNYGTYGESPGIDWNQAGKWAKSLLTGEGKVADYGTLFAGLMGLQEYMNRDRSPKTWQGTLTKGTYTPPTVSPDYYSGIMSRGYGKGAMGVNPFTGGKYTGPTEAQVYRNAQAPVQPFDFSKLPTPAPTAAPTAAPIATPTPTPAPIATPTPTAAPTTDPKAFIESLYQKYAGKTPSQIDSAGMQFWLDKFKGYTNPNEFESAFKAEVERLLGKTVTAAPTSAAHAVPAVPAVSVPTPASDLTNPWIDGPPIHYKGRVNPDTGKDEAIPYITSSDKTRYRAWLQSHPGYLEHVYQQEGLTYPYAEGGLAGLAHGGVPRYLRGETDGMADQIPSSIDGRQPAKLSHGEFVVPADVVSHLGNGNSDAGAKMLYKMMDRVRQARTGTKRQGKQIQPEKFMPGGIASLPNYAGGGAVAFADGGTTTPGTTAGGLSPWVGDYIAGPQGFLSKAWALGDQPYEAYLGPLTAGMSPLQTLAATGFEGLTTPSSIGSAANTAGDIATKLYGMGAYSPTTFGNQFTAPTTYQPTQFTSSFGYSPDQATQFGNLFQSPGAYQTGAFTPGFSFQPQTQATQFGNLFQAPDAYQPSTDFTQGIGQQQYGPTQFQTGLGPVRSVQDYMNQYTSGVSDIAAREATRQADISRQSEQARLAQAGAFGGSRQAIMEAERQRNLGQQIGDIRTKGLQEAYDAAQKQRLAEAGMGLEAQKASEASRQFGATYGQQGLAQLLQARQMGEQAKQFGATQGMTAAQLRAQYGLSAQQAQEAARQFGEGQRLTAAQLGSQFGLEAQKAAEASRQFGAQQGMQAKQLEAQYGLSAQQAQEAARQFNAGQKLTAAQLQEQFGLDKQKAQEMANQFAAQQGMQAAQLSAQYGLSGLQASEQAKQFGATYGLNALQQALAAAQAQGQLGQMGLTSDIARLNAIMGAGGTQQAAEQAAIDAQIRQFQEAQQWPYKQLEFQRNLLQGLPVSTQTLTPQTSGLSDLVGGVGGLLQLYQMLSTGQVPK